MVKIATLILSFIFVLVLIPSAQMAQAEQNQRKISVSFRPVSPQGNLDSKKYFSEQADNGASALSLIVSHGSVSYPMFADYNGNGYYRKTIYWFDIDANQVVNYYVVYYLDDYDGYGWWTSDNFKSDVFTIENGISPEEGMYIESFFYSGYKQKTEGVKIELYTEDGTLMDTYGPDDNPDLGYVPIESQQYDIKINPFISTPTPGPTPTPDYGDNLGITGNVVDANSGDDIKGAKASLKREGEVITTASSDENGEFVLQNLELEPGRYDLLVSKKGYIKKRLTVFLRKETGTENVTIRLRPKKR